MKVSRKFLTSTSVSKLLKPTLSFKSAPAQNVPGVEDLKITQFIDLFAAISVIDYLISIRSYFDNAFFFVGLFNSAIANPLIEGWFVSENNAENL